MCKQFLILSDLLKEIGEIKKKKTLRLFISFLIKTITKRIDKKASFKDHQHRKLSKTKVSLVYLDAISNWWISAVHIQS